MKEICTEESFLSDVKDHEMTVIFDNGVNRHIRFKPPEHSNYYFDLVTWKGYLCICGDMGTTVFSRIDDMFKFFRGHAINPDYWGEKVASESRFGNGVKDYSEDNFRETVKSVFDMYFEDDEDNPDREAIWADIKNDVLSCGENGYSAHDAATNFESHGFRFQNFWEHDLTEYTYHFIWCLRAIVWGISLYDIKGGQ